MTKTKRTIAAWVLLAVFLPMVLLSSLHFHESLGLHDDNCPECVQHHCQGHVAQLTTTMHACVICQFLTLTFVLSAVCAVLFFHQVSKIHIARHHSIVFNGVRGITSLRAPPLGSN